MIRTICALLLVVCSACGRVGFDPAPGLDGGALDASRDAGDAGHVGDHDAGGAIDGSAPDSGDIDAGPTDAGPRDAGAPDTGADGGDPRSLCERAGAGAIACWDFDAPLSLSPPTLTRDVSAFRAGAGSLRVQTEPGATLGVVERVLSEPLRSGVVYMRSFVRIPVGFAPSGWVVVMEMKTWEGSPQKISIEWGLSGSNRGGLNVTNTGVRTSFTSDLWRPGEWQCVELEVDIRTSGGAARVSVDGVPRLEITGTDTHLEGGMRVFRAGLIVEGSNPPLTLHHDEVLVRTTPIGCAY